MNKGKKNTVARIALNDGEEGRFLEILASHESNCLSCFSKDWDLSGCVIGTWEIDIFVFSCISLRVEEFDNCKSSRIPVL